MSDTEAPQQSMLQLTAQIVSAHVANNSVQTDNLANIIQQVYQALHSAGAEPAPTPDRPQPAVPIKKSVQQDYIICLEDGAKLKMLKRYIKARFGMTPAEYRKKWGLDEKYPMVAPNYAERRSTLAKSIGLGRKSEEVPQPRTGAKRGRKPLHQAA